MMKLNKAGAVTALTVYLWANGALVVSAVALTNSHRERKAVEYCIADGRSETDCHAWVPTLSKAEVVDYIRDTAERPRN